MFKKIRIYMVGTAMSNEQNIVTTVEML